MESLVISVLRQFVLVLPVAWGFSQLAKHSMDKAWTVWTTFIIAETVSAAVSFIFMKRIRRCRIEKLG